MSEQNTTWSQAEYDLLEKVINLVNARREGGYPSEGCGVTVDSNGMVPTMSAEDFAYKLAKELETVQDGGPTMLDYAIDEAQGDLCGMLGIKEGA